MNYEEMSDFEINKRVSGKFRKVWTWKDKVYLSISSTIPFDPCNNPSDAWPIILGSKITIMPDVYIGGWYARKDVDSGMGGDFFFMIKDDNPLRAAMICFLKMKDEIDGKH